MARPLPTSPDEWIAEIRLAWKDARETKSFANMAGTIVTDADLFHLAPLVCLKFRGRESTGMEADKVTKGALANYVVNTGPDAIVQGLESNPKMAFALCYVAAHLILGLVDEQDASDILDFCEEKLTGPKSDESAKAKSPILAFPGPSMPRKPESRQKVGRNDPCPCGSGKKFKTCCMKV